MHRHTQIEGSRPHWRRHATSASGAHRNCTRRAAPMRLASPWAPHRRGARRQSGLQACLLWNSRRTPVVPRPRSHSRPRWCTTTATRRRTLGLPAAAAAAKGRDQPASAANGAATRPARGLRRSAPGPRARHRMRAAMQAALPGSKAPGTASPASSVFHVLVFELKGLPLRIGSHRPFSPGHTLPRQA